MDRSGSEEAKWNQIGELPERKTEGGPYKKKYNGGVMLVMLSHGSSMLI